MKTKTFFQIFFGLLTAALLSACSSGSSGPSSYTVSGNISGLASGQSIVLQNNGTDDLPLDADGAFSFETALKNGSDYHVTVLVQPDGQTCNVSNGSGSAKKDVTEVSVVCAVNTYALGGDLTGLAAGQLVVLQNNGGDDLPLDADGSFRFDSPIAEGAGYAVTVKTQPENQLCTVTSHTGTVSEEVTNVAVSCIDLYSLSGTLEGVNGTVVLQSNTGDELPLDANVPFTFPTPLLAGSDYQVTVKSQPIGQTCSVIDGSGIADADITGISVVCTTDSYTVGGSLSGLVGTVVLQNSNGDDLPLNGNGGFTFKTAVAYGTNYNVSVKTQPATQTCTASSNSGTMGTQNVNTVSVVCSTNTYSVGGTVSNLSGTLVLQNNGGDDLTVDRNTFTFPTVLADGSGYSVSIKTQPATQTCSVTSGSGLVNGADVASVSVACVNTYTLGGNVTGLTGTLTLQNGSETLYVDASGPFAFDTRLLDGTTYSVAITQQPAGQTCKASNTTGIATTNVSGIAVTCESLYTIGGNLSGLSGTLVLQNNGGDDLELIADGPFAFSTPVQAGAADYNVTVLTQPTGQTCALTGNTGTASANVNDIAVDCTTNTYPVGGNLTGLSGTVVLQNNLGDDLPLTADGPFTFATEVAYNSPYSVSVKTQPNGQLCTASSSSGTMGLAAVTTVTVDCVNLYTIGGNVIGLTGTLMLQNNGGDDLELLADGPFTFATSVLASAANYNVTVLTQPTGQTCTLTGNTGTATSDVATVGVTCENTYTIGGSVTGLSGTLMLQNNGGDDLELTADGPFTFATSVLASAANYNVTVLTQPTGQTCVLTGNTGTASANVSDIAVACTTNTYPVGGNLTGLSGTVVLQNNLGDDLELTTDGPFTFATEVAYNSPYSVSVKTQPNGQLCTATNTSGMMGTAAVTTVTVDCVNLYTIGGNVIGLTGTLMLQNNGGDDLELTADGPFTFATSVLASAANYNVTVLTQPTGQTCALTGNTGTASADVTDIAVACTTNTYAVGGNLTGLSGTVVLQNNLGDDLMLNADGPFTFATEVAYNSPYSVSVKTQPTGQLCTATNNGGIMGLTAVTDVSVDCVNLYTIGGSVTGLTGTLMLQNNGGDDLELIADGPFTFTTQIPDGGSYNVTVASQPVSQECSVSDGSGVANGADLTEVLVVNCITVAPAAPEVSLSYGTKELRFSWSPVGGATHYKLFENPDGLVGYSQVGADLTVTEVSHEIALYRRINARYQVEACNSAGCTGSGEIFMASGLAGAIGYFKASNTGAEDRFGDSVALSGDGNTLAVGATWEDSAATGIDGDESDNSVADSGAVYLFTRIGGAWVQQAYVKASNTGAEHRFGMAVALSFDGNTLAVGAYQEDELVYHSGAVYVFTRAGGTWSQQAHIKASNAGGYDYFGRGVALSADGNTLAVGAYGEKSAATGIDGDQADNSSRDSGAVYLFNRVSGTWSQQAYIKASNSEAYDYFGWPVALSADGNSLAVGAYGERSVATGIDGDQADNSAGGSGAVYLFNRVSGIWSQEAYIKASNTGESDFFGMSVALSADGGTLAVGARGEDSAATGIEGDQSDNSASNSGAVYLFSRVSGTWSQQAYIKASNTEAGDFFGVSVALSADGNTLAVGAAGEDSVATGIDGDQSDDSTSSSGAVYLFTRTGNAWSQLVYSKASNTGLDDLFGYTVALSDDGNTLAVGAVNEDGASTGIDGDQTSNTQSASGAVYLY